MPLSKNYTRHLTPITLTSTLISAWQTFLNSYRSTKNTTVQKDADYIARRTRLPQVIRGNQAVASSGCVQNISRCGILLLKQGHSPLRRRYALPVLQSCFVNCLLYQDYSTMLTTYLEKRPYFGMLALVPFRLRYSEDFSSRARSTLRSGAREL